MQIPEPVHHEVAKLTKGHEELFVQDRFVSLRGLRAFVIHRICLIGWLLLIAPAQGIRAGETIDRVLALVAGQLITLTDVTAARDLGLVSADAAADPVRAVLSKLIDRELILAEADRYAPPEPDTGAIDREIERVRARFQSPQAFDLALARSGIDEKHLRETLREDLRIGAYLDQRFTVPNGPGSPGSEDRRQALVGEWLAGLRRRADIIDFYLPGR
jgi:hypothetical protein